MKPSDFFLGSRQFFGFLIPGVVWLSAILLILVNTCLRKLLAYAAAANWIGSLCFLALALVIGMLTQDRSFGFSRWISRRLTEYERRNLKRMRSLGSDPGKVRIAEAGEGEYNEFASPAKPHLPSGTEKLHNSEARHTPVEFERVPQSRTTQSDRLRGWLLGEQLAPKRYRAALSREAAEIIRERFTGARVPPRLYFDPADRHYQGERQIFAVCKRSMLSRSPVLGQLLREKEDEINLVGMLPLPLIFLIVGLLAHVSDVRDLPVRGDPAHWGMGTLLLGAAVIIHLLFRFHQLRKEEFRICLESFLLVESGLADGRTAVDAAKDTEKQE